MDEVGQDDVGSQNEASSDATTLFNLIIQQRQVKKTISLKGWPKSTPSKRRQTFQK